MTLSYDFCLSLFYLLYEFIAMWLRKRKSSWMAVELIRIKCYNQVYGLDDVYKKSRLPHNDIEI